MNPEYYESPHWLRLRFDTIAKAGCKCKYCGKSNSLEVHHKVYTHLGNEKPEELEVVCTDCHNDIHPNKPKRQLRAMSKTDITLRKYHLLKQLLLK